MKKIITALTVLTALAINFTPTSSEAKTLNFSGYTWTIKNGTAMGPGPNNWSDGSGTVPSTATIDENGNLKLVVTKVGKNWYSSEIYLSKSLGYGRYEFDILTMPETFDHNLIAAPFLYQNDSKELDIEYSYWGDEADYNTTYSVQPYTNKSNVAVGAPNKKNFQTFNANYTSYSMITGVIDWSVAGIKIYTKAPDGKVLNTYNYVGKNNFAPGKERLHINFWQYHGAVPKNNATNTFIVKAFRFTAAS